MEAILSSFVMVALSEMGDKTQLLAFSLAARYRKPLPVLSGILVATILNHLLAASLGTWISLHIPRSTMAAILAVLFIGFGFWTLKPDTLEEEKEKSRWGAFATTTLLFFLAEMGDKTQFATIALAAHYQSTFLVTTGTTLGMMFSDGLAVLLGEKLAHKAQSKWVRIIAASLFFLFGVLSGVEAYRARV